MPIREPYVANTVVFAA